MRIFLTGGTGYLGSAIARALAAAGHAVTALARSEASAARVPNAHRGDLRDPLTYRDVALQHDAIIHAGIEGGGNRLDVDRIVVEALRGRTLIYTSTLFVLGNVDGGDETATAQGPRAETERLVLDAGGAVVRPGMIIDAESWMLTDPLIIDGGTNRWPIVHRDDIAQLYRLIAEQQARGIFHGVCRVVRARDLTPNPRNLSLEEARTVMGGFADLLALDQNVIAKRAQTLGWRCGQQTTPYVPSVR
ncbi:MAG TPA: NAD-dependent epimerase/dehydratase family protein [Thermoanaerobaculia bacterium]|jgi:nucleoside-diphosphate-sugar epimerase